MSDFTDGLARIEALVAERARKPAPLSELVPSADALLPTAFKVGARVRDRVTGQDGTVVVSTFRHVVTPSAEESMLRLPDAVELEVLAVRLVDGQIVARTKDELVEVE